MATTRSAAPQSKRLAPLARRLAALAALGLCSAAFAAAPAPNATAKESTPKAPVIAPLDGANFETLKATSAAAIIVAKAGVGTMGIPIEAQVDLRKDGAMRARGDVMVLGRDGLESRVFSIEVDETGHASGYLRGNRFVALERVGEGERLDGFKVSMQAAPSGETVSFYLPAAGLTRAQGCAAAGVSAKIDAFLPMKTPKAIQSECAGAPTA